MANLKTSESTEMYLITIATMTSDGRSEPLPITSLAEELHVQPVSANQMVKKMAKSGWLEYIPYKGVLLTDKGYKHAFRVLRHRRLWEVFFVRELEMSVDEADALACDLEHLISEDIANRLDAFLGYPTISYTGYPIPKPGDDRAPFLEKLPLSDFQVGENAQVIRIDADVATAKFFSHEQIKPGVRVRIVATGSSGDFLIENNNRRIHISADLTSALLLGRIEEK